MKREILEYVAKYGMCQQVKVEHQKSAKKLQPLMIPEWKWKDVTMNFVSGLPRGKRGNDGIWVIMNCLTIFALFLIMKMTNWIDKLDKLYVNEIVRLHEVPMLIVSNQNPIFTLCSWPSIQHVLGMKLNLSIIFTLRLMGSQREPSKS